MKTLINRIPDGFYALLLFTLLFLFAFTVTRAQGNLVLKGVVMHPEENTARPYAEIIGSNGEHMSLEIRPNGKFWVCAPANDKYIIRFMQAGCVPKEVMVDARHATSASAHNDRKFEFDVVLTADDGEQAMRFNSPVGRVEFHSSTGRAHVAHHYEMVPVSQLLAEDAK